MASKGKKGKKKASRSGARAFLVILVLAAAIAAFFYFKPAWKEKVSGDFSSKVDSETEETLSRFDTSFILIDSKRSVDSESGFVSRKQSVRAYSLEDASNIVDALSLLAKKHDIEFSAPRITKGANKDSEFNVSFSKEGNVLQLINISVDRRTGRERELKGKLAIIIDDIGGDIKKAGLVADLDFPVTMAILPGLEYTREAARIAKEKGKEIILHCPMEAENRNENPGPGALKNSMTNDEILKVLMEDIDAVQGIKGVNNHMGSKFTGDAEKIRIVLKELKKRGLYFIDSRTNSTSRAYGIAKELGLLTAENAIFLDNKKEVPEIAKNIAKAAGMADKNGSAVAICHPNPETILALKMKIPELKEAGIKMVFASELVK